MKLLRRIAKIRNSLVLPRSLYGRFFLITIAPLLITQIMVVYIFYERHWSSVARNMSTSLSGEIGLIIREFDRADPVRYQKISEEVQNFMALSVDINSKENENFDSLFDIEKNTKIEMLAESDHQGFRNALKSFSDYKFEIASNEESRNLIVKILLPANEFRGTSILTVKAPAKRLVNSSTYIFVLWVAGMTILTLIIALLFLRNQVRSIVNLSNAAEDFGKGNENAYFKPSGAREIRKAGIAFVEMRERIKRLLNRRTEMLAGVSHDLRTPLTRMRLQLALLPNKNRQFKQEMEQEIREMLAMLEGYLDFARGAPDEAFSEERICSLISEYIKQFDMSEYEGKQIKLEEVKEPITLSIQKSAFKRCMVNLLTNGLRYGGNIWVKIEKYENTSLQRSNVNITIEDDGAGIPVEKYEEVFQPFVRLEESRNSDTGGVGLGLSIVRDIVHRHGGRIRFNKSKTHGGLKVIVSFPL